MASPTLGDLLRLNPALGGSGSLLAPSIPLIPSTPKTKAVVKPPASPVRPTVATVASGSSAAAPVYADRSGDIMQQNAGLGAVNNQISGGIKAINSQLGDVNRTYNTEAAAEKTSYDTNTGQNKLNLSKNQQTALVNAAQGRQGLNGVLASLGALNGSGVELATRAVQKGANEDLAGASDNYATNANALDTANGMFLAQDKERRLQAIKDAKVAKQRVQNTGLQSRLGYYQNLSNDYMAEGDKANGTKFAKLASALFPEIGSTTIPATGPTYSAASYTAPALSSYLHGTNIAANVTPASAATGGIPGLSASTTRKKAVAV